ncbi:hypothetical protein ABGB12_28245 [Actinocorallia sp. B10E7]|uniref:hypothetical protein n=1 Tax=Actinocorallia sp. B10E7 TaxID=3153558 RepID=UPI00325DA355
MGETSGTLALCQKALERCRRGGSDLASALEALERTLPSPLPSHGRRSDNLHLATKIRLNREAITVLEEICFGEPPASVLAVALPLLGRISEQGEHHRLFLDRFGHLDPAVRAAAALGLARLNTRVCLPPVQGPMLNLLRDPAAHVRASVVRALWLLDRTAARSASSTPLTLILIASQDPDPEVRKAAADEIERYRNLGNPWARTHAP